MAAPLSQYAGDIEKMSRPPTDAPAAPTAHAVVLLSERGSDAVLLQQLLALSERPLFTLQVMSSEQFSATSLWHADLLLIDRQFGRRHYLETLSAINTSRDPASTTKLAILLDEAQLADDLAALPTAVNLGADGFLLKSELSLKRLMQFINGTLPGTTHIESPLTAPLYGDGPSITTTEPIAPLSTERKNRSEEEGISRDTTQPQHQLNIDLENRLIHLGNNPNSPLAQQGPTLSIEKWLAQLDDRSASDFTQLLQRASQFQAIPDALDCNFRSADGNLHPALLSDIRIKENGQGRVTAASAQLQFDDVLAKTSDRSATHSGFDNLGDSSALPTVERIWRDLTQSLPVMCLLLEGDGHITRIINGDPSTQQFFPEARIGQTLTELLGNDAPQNTIENIERALNTGKSQQHIICFNGNHGVRWLDTHITRLRGDISTSRQVVWTAFDITQTKQAHQELIKNHDVLTDMLDDAPLLFCQKDTNGRYQRANSAFCDTFNIQPNAIVGRRDSEIFDPEAAQNMTRGEDKIIGHGNNITYTQNELIDGRSQLIHWNKFAIREQSGKTIQSIIIFGLLGEQGGSESLQNNTTADKEVASKLSPSGAIGQDFKLLISSIISYTEIALSQNNIRREQRIIEHLNQLIGVGEKARDLIVSSSPSKKDSDEIQAVEIQPLVKNMVAMLKPTLPASLNFRADIDRANGSAAVAPANFQRLVMQLLISARDSARSVAAEDSNQIFLRLENICYENLPCTACRAMIEGDYIALSVQTKSNGINKEELLELVESSDLTIKKEGSSPENKSNNIIIMAHENGGHIIVDHKQDTISLQLLFKKTK